MREENSLIGINDKIVIQKTSTTNTCRAYHHVLCQLSKTGTKEIISF